MKQNSSLNFSLSLDVLLSNINPICKRRLLYLTFILIRLYHLRSRVLSGLFFQVYPLILCKHFSYPPFYAPCFDHPNNTLLYLPATCPLFNPNSIAAPAITRYTVDNIYAIGIVRLGAPPLPYIYISKQD
jgi:hypothetical protein